MRGRGALLLAWGCAALPAAASTTAYAGKDDCRVVDRHPQPGQTASWDGPCKNGYAEGSGALQWSVDGAETERYEGAMAAGQPHGKGIYLYRDGSRYQGEFRDGLRHGRGAQASGAIDDGAEDVMAGQFDDDRAVGPVTLRYANGNRYTGGWNNGKEGQGRQDYAYGGSYEGGWRRGLPYGEGVITYPNGTVLKGVFDYSFQLGERGNPDNPPPAPALYQKKDDAYHAGTRIRRNAGSGFKAPQDKPYAELTAEQQRAIRLEYEILQPGDEPPYPLKGMWPLTQSIRVAAGERQALGKLEMMVFVDADGKAASVSVTRAPERHFRDAVARIVMLQRFKPALCGGLPCAMGMPIAMMLVAPED